MELFLIRHGETVDNVAGLYAGSRDSSLTNHGVEQARRLGEHFAKEEVDACFDYIFASPLSRAFKTAQAIQIAQLAASTRAPRAAKEHSGSVDIVRVPELVEQDFGFYEGKSFQARTDPGKTGKEAHRERHKDDPGFVDIESKDSLNERADKFLDVHLLPLFENRDPSRHGAIAVVSHGILLSHLWRRLLLRLPPKTVTVAPDIIANKGSIVLQHLGGWSNTGYLQLLMSKEEEHSSKPSLAPVQSISTDKSPSGPGPENNVPTGGSPRPTESNLTPKRLVGWETLIVAIDRKDHLVGLKRQRGGIGRSAHDEGQQKLTGFFKKRRTS